MSSSAASLKYRKRPAESLGFPSNRASIHNHADTPTVRPATQSPPGADPNQTVVNICEPDVRPMRKSFLSIFRSKNLPVLDDQLFNGAKTAQWQPNWPSAFGVPADNGPRDHAVFHGKNIPGPADDGRSFYRGGNKPRLDGTRQEQATKIVEHVQSLTFPSGSDLSS